LLNNNNRRNIPVVKHESAETYVLLDQNT